MKAITLAVSVAFCVGFLELVARQLFPLIDCPNFDHRLPHPLYGWSLEPNARYRCALPEASAEVFYNSRGWRDVEPAPEPRADLPRVVVLGDSYMEAYTVDFADSFASRLEAESAASGVVLDAVNLGVGGYGTLQAYLVFRDHGADPPPDLVLLGFYPSNDLANNTRALEMGGTEARARKAATRPFLDPDAEAWRLTEVDYEGASRRAAQSRAPLRRFTRKLRARSALFEGIVTGNKRLRARFDSRSADEKARIADAQELRMLGVHRCREQPAYSQAWSLTRRILVRLRDAVEATGARLVVFTIPALQEVESASQERFLETTRDPASYCIEDALPNARLAALLDELGIGLIDLLPAFRAESRKRGARLFLESDRHWNAAGHRLAARLVAGEIVGAL